MELVVEGGIVVTMNAGREILAPGYVAVSDGQVSEVAAGPFRGEARERIDVSGCVVLPGLVNAHNHLDQSLYRSCLDEHGGSRERLLRLAKGLTRERARFAAALTLLEQVKYGITTTHESHWTHYHPDSTDGICEAVIESGMRSVVARSMNDNEYTPAEFREPVEDVIDDLDRLERAYDSERLQIISEPTTVLRCTPEAVRGMRQWALKRGKLWHMHLAQNREELHEALGTVGMGSVQYAETLGVLGPELLAAHCSGILDEEVDLLAGYGVRIAHCPDPVIRGGGRVPPIWQLERIGAIVAIATDGSATNNGQNIWEAMKLAVYMQRVRFKERYLGSAEMALEMATIKAARALGMDARVGSLEIGKQADMAVFQLDQLHLVPDAMLINNLVYSGVSTHAELVIVDGRIILRNGYSTVLDEDRKSVV